MALRNHRVVLSLQLLAGLGAVMGAADYAHWHGFFELQQDLYKLKTIYEKRMSSGEIE